MKTYTEQRIELGQDINNTWTLIAAMVASNPKVTVTDDLFNCWFPIVRSINTSIREVQ